VKIRNGFVSNSSSSSFIVGIGEIKNKNLLKEYFEKYGIQENYEIKVGDKVKLKEHINSSGDSITVDVCNSMSLTKNIKDDTEYLIAQITNDEGDSDFWVEEDGDFDYSSAEDVSYYCSEQQKIIELFNNSNIITDGEVAFGAERNG